MDHRELYPSSFGLRWQMTHGERLALIALLAQRRPEVSIEIGTSSGGSLQVLSAYSSKVYSLDLDRSTPQRLAAATRGNVEFITGNSSVTLPWLLADLRQRGQAFGFALVDGDHTAAGVQRDLKALIEHPPLDVAWIVMHDAANATVREGITRAGWKSHPHVQLVDLDLVQGWYHSDGEFAGQMWGGFALAIIAPQPRPGPLVIQKGQQDLLRFIDRRLCQGQPGTAPGRFVSGRAAQWTPRAVARRLRRRLWPR
jgi:hypothetical protein